MCCFTRLLIYLLSFSALFSGALFGKEINRSETHSRNITGWSSGIQVGSQFQFDTDLDHGGSYRHQQFNVQASRTFLWDLQTSASLALSYGNTSYHFSGGDVGTDATPWGDVHSLSLSTPLRKGVNDQWSVLIVPIVNFAGESNANFNDALTGGIFAAANYRFNKNLTIGPGFAAMSQLQDSVSFFPLLLIKWNISDKLKFNVGRDMNANQGAGVTLSYKANQNWMYSIGGYYQQLRFRLNKNGDVASGVGEESGFPVVASVNYSLNPAIKMTLIAGVELDGELIVEDNDGDEVYNDSSSSGLIGGALFSMRF